MALIDEISDALVAASVGVKPPNADPTLFHYALSEQIDACSMITIFPGLTDEHQFGSQAPLIEKPSMQFMSRGAPGDTVGPYAKCLAARTALSGTARTFGSTFYRSILATSPFHLKTDDSRRLYFVVNFQVQKDP